MMTMTEDTWQFSVVSSVSALLYDQTKYEGRKHCCLWCLLNFTTEEILRRHGEVCKELNVRKMRTAMPKKVENLSFS